MSHIIQPTLKLSHVCKRFLSTFQKEFATSLKQPRFLSTQSSTSSEYEETFNKSIRLPQTFWDEVAQDITWFKKYDKVLDHSNPPFTKWFVGGHMNTCYEGLDVHVINGHGQDTAMIYDSPVTNTKQHLNYEYLLDQVSRFARVLVNNGVQKGDRVIIYMPMIPEAIVAMYACARIGAIHSVVFGGFAAHELARRIDDAEPKMLVTATCGVEPTRIIEYEPLVHDALQMANHQVKNVITVNREQCPRKNFNPHIDIDWHEAMEATTVGHDCVPIEANEPLYILYTSGTTGKPKGVVRPCGGHAVALKWSLPKLYDVHPGDVWWAASDIGWVVGHSYIVYAPFFNKSTRRRIFVTFHREKVLHKDVDVKNQEKGTSQDADVKNQGKPIGCPDASTFFRIIDEHKVKALFTAPTAIRVIRNEDHDGEFAKKYSMSRERHICGIPQEKGTENVPEFLRQRFQITPPSRGTPHVIYSTKLFSFKHLFLAGENADKEILQWASNVFRSPIIDHWWQTESGWPITSHHVGLGLPGDYSFGTIGKPTPGFNVKVLDDNDKEVKPGELGQIYIKLPLPPGAFSTLYNSDERFVDVYFKTKEGYYNSMDAGTIDENGYIQIGGRVDDIINVAGHRLSTKQIEMAVAKHDDVMEEAVIGVKDAVKGEQAVGLIVLRKGYAHDPEVVKKEIIDLVRRDVGPVASFKQVYILPTLPKTRAGKFLRGTMKKILDGEEYTMPQTVENSDDFLIIEKLLKEQQEMFEKQN